MPRSSKQAARKTTQKTARTKRPLTPRQRLAIDRRIAAREIEEHMQDIREQLQEFGENYRAKAARALCVILQAGPVFAVACAKAKISRAWPISSPLTDLEVWAFIDAENQRFAESVPADTVARWNAPDYELPAELQKAGE